MDCGCAEGWNKEKVGLFDKKELIRELIFTNRIYPKPPHAILDENEINLLINYSTKKKALRDLITINIAHYRFSVSPEKKWNATIVSDDPLMKLLGVTETVQPGNSPRTLWELTKKVIPENKCLPGRPRKDKSLITNGSPLLIPGIFRNGLNGKNVINFQALRISLRVISLCHMIDSNYFISNLTKTPEEVVKEIIQIFSVQQILKELDVESLSLVEDEISNSSNILQLFQR